jgi:lipopolysaccharide/colanic/teichoic acid biosynthesis glycosyltransferase
MNLTSEGGSSLSGIPDLKTDRFSETPMDAPLIKRLFDILCASLGLLFLLPVGLLIGLLIKLSDGGPIFYGQIRIGQFGKPFRIRKFRSMVVNADKIGVPLTKEEDPRITWIGRFLRKSKLDELPQLWNVLVGEMSFVGPRPEVPRYVDLYTAEQREVLKYRPGITDIASMLFRNEEALLRGAADVEGFYLKYCLPKKIELNRQYAESASVLRDIWVILQTLCPYWLAILTIYGAALAASYWLSYQLRSDFRMDSHDYEEFRRCLPWIVFPQLVLLFWRGQFRGLLSYFSVPELRRTASALGVALVFQVGLCFAFLERLAPTRSIFLMDLFLSFFSLCGVRVAFRVFRERSSQSKVVSQAQVWRVALIGTGELATNLALDFARSSHPRRRVVAFFDDNPHLWNRRAHDIPVIGMPECLLNPDWQNKIDEVIVALPVEEATRLQEIREMLKGLPLKVTFASGWPVLEPSDL